MYCKSNPKPACYCTDVMPCYIVVHMMRVVLLYTVLRDVLIRSNMYMVSPLAGGRHEVWYIIDAKYHRVMGQKLSRKNRLFPGLERQGSFVPKLQPNNGVVSCSQSKYSVVFFEGGTTTTPGHRRLSNPQPLWVTTGLDVHDSTHTTGLEPPSMQYNNDRRKLLHLRI